MSDPRSHVGMIYGYPVRFVRQPPEPGHPRTDPLPLCVVLNDLASALDLRPAVASVLTSALAMHTGCGWGTVKLGRRNFGAPAVEFARWLVMDALALGCIGRRALAEFDRAVMEAEAKLLPTS